jgi:hypothetical protein
MPRRLDFMSGRRVQLRIKRFQPDCHHEPRVRGAAESRNLFGFLKNRTFLEVLTGLRGAIAFIKK